MSNELRRLALGQPYMPGVTYGDTERFEYHYDSGTHLLQCILPRISEREVKAFQSGPVHVGLYDYNGSIFFLYKIEGIYDWSDQSFALAMLPPERRIIPPCGPGEHLLLTMALVESTTGIVKGIRAVTYSAHMSAVFTQLLKAQIDRNLTVEEHQQNVSTVYRAYPHSTALVAAAQITERAGLKGQ